MMNKIPMWALFGVPTLIIIVGGAIFFTKSPTVDPDIDSSKPQEVSSSVEGVQEHDISGRAHIADSQKSQNYTTNPPSSGDHWASPADNGIYDKQLPDERVLHNLEHGYVWISYKQNITDELLQTLKNIVNDDDWKMILSPREENESQIAIVSWGRILNMEDIDEEKIKEFIKIYRNRGEEKTPD